MTTPTEPTDDVVIERTFDAPVDVVWALWTRPEHFQAWWGPIGATIPSAELDVRVGGRRLVCMEIETPDGTMQLWFGGEHLEVVEPHRLVYTEHHSDPDGNVVAPADVGMPDGHPTVTEVEVLLEDLGDRTKVVMTHRGVPAGSPGAAGWQMAFDKLATRAAAST